MGVKLYVATCLDNGKRYVGITRSTIERRWKAHCQAARKNSQFVLHCAIRKHGECRFTCEQRASFETWQEACEAEVKSIVDLGTHVSVGRGYNMTSGGEGIVGLSDESKARIAAAHRRENLSSETIKKMSDAKLGRRLPEPTKVKMSAAHTGRRFTDEHKRKIGQANSIENCSDEKRKKISAAASKPVEQVSADGELLATFASMKAAAEATGIHWANISGCCCGTRHKAGGFRWRYA